jgi:hypothetical protein
LPLINSGGFLASAMPANTKPQFATGPQKWTVLGPVGDSSNALNLDPRDPALAAMTLCLPNGMSCSVKLEDPAQKASKGGRFACTA